MADEDPNPVANMRHTSEFYRLAPIYATQKARLFGLPGEFLALAYVMIVLLDMIMPVLYGVAISFGTVFLLKWILKKFGYEEGAIKYASQWLATHPTMRKWLPDFYRQLARTQRRSGQVPLVAAGTTLYR